MKLSLLITKSSSEIKNIQLIPLCLIRPFAFCMKILIHLPIQCQCYPQMQTSHLICCANQLIGFCTRTTLAFNGLSVLWSLFHFTQNEFNSVTGDQFHNLNSMTHLLLMFLSMRDKVRRRMLKNDDRSFLASITSLRLPKM